MLNVVYGGGIYTIANDLTVTFPSDPSDYVIPALARECRFGNHTSHHYSVAEHSVYVAERVFIVSKNPMFALQGLWHEAAEGLGFRDINGPLKKRYAKNLMKAEHAVCKEVFGRRGIDWPIAEVVHQVDAELAQIEGPILVPRAHEAFNNPPKDWSMRLACWAADKAESEFRACHKKYLRMVESLR